MKFTFLAAAALIATPVIAQTTPATQDATPSAATPSAQTTPAADPAMPAPAADPAMATPPAAPMPMAGATPAGGYQPTGPATSGPVAPGASVRFQPAPSPDQAYPAPAPMAKYPVCKKGQYDGCMERGGKK